MTTGTRTIPTGNPGASPREQYEIKALKPVAGVTLDQLYYVWGFTFFHLYNGYNNRKLPPTVSVTT